jgi:serine/threonine protein kinase/Flp pilus assembly protein TadD
MSLSSGRRTWDEASSPAAVRLAREYEQAWRDSSDLRNRPDPHEFLDAAGGTAEGAGARLALFRADMGLRWESGDRSGAQWYLDRFSDLTEDTIVALIYEEFCLREEDDAKPDPAEYLTRFSQVEEPLRRVLEIHDLVGSGETSTALALSTGGSAGGARSPFPEAGESIGGFVLVEELGRGAFARVFLARERELADRPVALKVTRRGSREPQTLARLQHTHIVPVHSHRVDRASGLHLLCMPYFGRVTLARVLAECRAQEIGSGVALLEVLDRLEPSEPAAGSPQAGRAAVAGRSFARAVAWWGARLAEALGHAHDRGVLHRDIKPSNVLVTADAMPMLLDFNLAREPVADDDPAGGSASLGGTIDYMAPEHLQALAAGTPESVDGRSDIYSLGVVLFEAVTGTRPFAPPRRGASVVDSLLGAADLRRRAVPRAREVEPEIPPALDAVIGRCLQPEPADRYQSAAELAADLEATAVDLPLPHAREPWRSRASGWVRRRRRALAMATSVLLALGAVLLVPLGLLVESAESAKLVKEKLGAAMAAYERGEFHAAKEQLDAVVDLIDHFDKLDVRTYPARLTSVPATFKALAAKLSDVHFGPSLDEMKILARGKAQLADRIAQTRDAADDLFRAGESLRFRLLLGRDDELTGAIQELQRVLKPFYVLEAGDWTKLEHILVLLDQDRRDRLRRDVNELLFFWMAAIAESLSSQRGLAKPGGPPADRTAIATAVAICDHALTFVAPKEPWLALRALLERSATIPERPTTKAPRLFDDHQSREPADVAQEYSALPCFQWALLCLWSEQLNRAIDWMRQAVRLDPGNYWYRYFLAYVEDQGGHTEDAMNQYSTALALEPDSPWILFSRARLYRARGAWSWAIDDLKRARDAFGRAPESRKVQFELGYLYQELGDFARARNHYGRVLDVDSTDEIARAARLNQANIDVESRSIERGRAEYDALLSLAPEDTVVRQSRAILALRLGQAAPAEKDLDVLLDNGFVLKNRSEILGARVLARLLLGRPAEAMRDAEEARRHHPCPAHERLWQRALLAAREHGRLQLIGPDELARLPLGGPRLDADLRAAAKSLIELAAGRSDSAYRAAINGCIILAALGETQLALTAAGQALALSPFSWEAYLVRGRVRLFVGDRAGAMSDVNSGLAIHSDEPALLELRGILRHAAGNPRAAIDDFDWVIARGAVDDVHSHKALALAALGRHHAAAREWSLALRHDPERAESFFGRACAYLETQQWDLALADLEQAASWAQSDPRVEVAVVGGYLRCLKARPDRLPRLLVLAHRALCDAWRSLEGKGRLTAALD